MKTCDWCQESIGSFSVKYTVYDPKNTLLLHNECYLMVIKHGVPDKKKPRGCYCDFNPECKVCNKTLPFMVTTLQWRVWNGEPILHKRIITSDGTVGYFDDGRIRTEWDIYPFEIGTVWAYLETPEVV